MSTSDRTRDPLGLGDRPPVPSDPTHDPTAPTREILRRINGIDTDPELQDAQEPDSLTIPAAAVAQMIEWALQTQPGAAWFNGFLTGRGEPSWIASRQWALHAQEAEIVKSARQSGQTGPLGPLGQPANGRMR